MFSVRNSIAVALLLVVSTCLGQDIKKNGQLVQVRLVELSEDVFTELSEFDESLPKLIAQVELRAISYVSDGLRVNGYLASPLNAAKLPCVIWNRGGNRDFGALDDQLATLFLTKLASWGYVVVAPQYRGNAGGEGREQFGGEDVNDVTNLLPLLDQLPSADSSRIGMIGWSRGGLMTCLALCKTDRIKAAIIGSGMFDAHRAIAERPEMETEVIAQLAPNYDVSKQQALDDRSPVLWADRLNPTTPIMILHGTDDDRVSPIEALDMAKQLLASKHPFRLVMFEGAGHRLHLDKGDEVDELTKRWLDFHLK